MTGHAKRNLDGAGRAAGDEDGGVVDATHLFQIDFILTHASVSPTACRARAQRRAGTRSDRLGESFAAVPEGWVRSCLNARAQFEATVPRACCTAGDEDGSGADAANLPASAFDPRGCCAATASARAFQRRLSARAANRCIHVLYACTQVGAAEQITRNWAIRTEALRMLRAFQIGMRA